MASRGWGGGVRTSNPMEKFSPCDFPRGGGGGQSSTYFIEGIQCYSSRGRESVPAFLWKSIALLIFHGASDPRPPLISGSVHGVCAYAMAHQSLHCLHTQSMDTVKPV